MSAHFGPAGHSISFGKKKIDQLPDYLKQFDLDAFEYQCGRGVRISQQNAKHFGQLMQGFALSVHAPYYISLSSTDPEKRDNSIGYILASAKAANDMHATRVIVHSGSCGKISRQDALSLASDTLSRAIAALDQEGLSHIALCPETMGKTGQLGTLDEVIALCSLDERLIPCIDFGHLNARTFGGIKGSAEYKSILDALENKLGSDRAKRFHSHFSKIQFTHPGGEKCHLTFEDNQYGPEFEPLANLIVQRGMCPTFICESAGTQAEDAAVMKKMYLEKAEHHSI